MEEREQEKEERKKERIRQIEGRRKRILENWYLIKHV